MKKLITTTLCLLPLSVSACGTNKNEIRLIVLPSDHTEGQETKEMKAITRLIDESLPNHTVRVINATSIESAVTAMAFGGADMVWSSGGAMIEAQAERQERSNTIKPILSFAEDGDKTKSGYFSCVGTNKTNESYFASVTNQEERIKLLENKSMTFTSRTSSSGGKVPSNEYYRLFGPNGLNKINQKYEVFEPNKIFSNVLFGMEHATSILNMLEGKTFASSYWCESETTTINSTSNVNNYSVDDIYHIAKLHVPGDPLWVNTDTITPELESLIKGHLLAVNPTNAPDLYNDNNQYFKDNSYRFIEMNNSDYEILK